MTRRSSGLTASRPRAVPSWSDRSRAEEARTLRRPRNRPMCLAAVVVAITVTVADGAASPSSSSPPPKPPAFHFGPTANLPPGPLAALVASLASDLDGWTHVRAVTNASGGALHLRFNALAVCSAEQQRALAGAAAAAPFRVSVESGGGMCGPGSGAARANATLEGVAPFLAAGGKIHALLMESVFSRTHAACPSQPHGATARELAQFAAALKRALGNSTLFFLYDALPHFAVGADFPANLPKYGLELGALLRALAPAMAAEGVALTGYWMDCPFEYSDSYPIPGRGFDKVAAAVKLIKSMGLLAGKTFNSQAGGQASDEAFFNGTMSDVARTRAVVPSAASGGHELDFAMVETWYTHPADALPESKAYTTAFAALAAAKELGL